MRSHTQISIKIGLLITIIIFGVLAVASFAPLKTAFACSCGPGSCKLCKCGGSCNTICCPDPCGCGGTTKQGGCGSCDEDGGGGPGPTPTPAPWTAQGLRVRLSDYGDAATISSQTVTLYKNADVQLRSVSTVQPFSINSLSKVINQPPTPAYSYGEQILNSTYTASISVPSGWDVFSTWCKNRIDCHGISSPRTGNPVELVLGREGGYVDLWWHFVAPPSNLKALCNKYGTQATLSWNGPSDIPAYPIRVDRVENPNTPFACDPNSTGPTNVCRDIPGTSTTINVDIWADYGWWIHSGNYWNAVAGSNFRCNAAPSAHVYIQEPNCPRYPGEYSTETAIEFDGYASAQGGLASSDLFIAKKCGDVLCEYTAANQAAWCEGGALGEMQYTIAGGTRGSFCRIKRVSYPGTDTLTQHYDASWKPNEVGTYYAVINAKSANPADFQCSGNPRCEYSQSSLTKYGATACEDGRYAACQLGGEEGKVAYPIVGGGGANLWGESIEFQVRTAAQCVIPIINITVKNKEGGNATVPWQGFTYDCHPTYALCFSDTPLANASSTSPRSMNSYPGGAGIVLANNQILLGVSPVPEGGSLNTVNGNRAAPAPVYERSTTTWTNYWWNPYPDVPLRSVNFVVATHTPTPTNTTTPTTMPQLKVTGAIQQRTGKAGSYIYRNASSSYPLPFIESVSVNNNTHWTIAPYTTTTCATPAQNMNIVGGAKVGYTATYTFPAYIAGKGYCVPQVVTASGFKIPVVVSIAYVGGTIHSSYTSLAPYQVDVTTVNPTILNIPFRFNSEEWIRLKDTSFTRPVSGNITNKIPFIVDKFLAGTATQGNIGTGDTDDLLSKNMISETVNGGGGFIPFSVTLNYFNKPSTNGWKLPNGYVLNSGFATSLENYVTQVLRSQGVTDVVIGEDSPDKVLAAGFNKAPHNKSVGTITTTSGLPAVLIVMDGGSLGDITITKDTGISPLLIIANKISISKDVTAINAILVANDKIDLNGGTATDKPFKVKGNVVTGGGMINLRSRSDDDHARPSMFIQFDYDMYQKLMDVMGVVGSGS